MKNMMLKTGKELIIRKCTVEDAERMVKYKKNIYRESDFTTLQEHDVDLNILQEYKDIRSINSTNNSIIILGLINNEVIGSIVLRSNSEIKTRHIGELSITIRKSHWGLGIGSLLIESLIDWAKQGDLIKKINLRVLADNENVIKLYKKYGFQQEGLITRDLYVNGQFYNSIIMGLAIN